MTDTISSAMTKEEYEEWDFYDSIDASARKDVIKQKYTQYHRLRLDMGEGLTKHETLLMDKLNALKEKASRRDSNRYYWFITIRPSQDADKQIYLQRLNHFLDSKKITDYAYVCEVTDKLPPINKGKFLVSAGYTGFHTHLIIKNNKYEKNKIIRDVKNALNRSGKKHLDIITNDAMIDVDGRRFDHLENTIKYMEGRKKDTNKKEAIENTIAWRKIFPYNSSRACGFKLDLLEDTLV